MILFIRLFIALIRSNQHGVFSSLFLSGAFIYFDERAWQFNIPVHYNIIWYLYGRLLLSLPDLQEALR